MHLRQVNPGTETKTTYYPDGVVKDTGRILVRSITWKVSTNITQQENLWKEWNFSEWQRRWHFNLVLRGWQSKYRMELS
jgi:hypothetical protein